MISARLMKWLNVLKWVFFVFGVLLILLSLLVRIDENDMEDVRIKRQQTRNILVVLGIFFILIGFSVWLFIPKGNMDESLVSLKQHIHKTLSHNSRLITV